MKHAQRFMVFLLIIIGCNKSVKKETVKQEGGEEYSFYLGTYTDTYSKGIYQYILYKDGSFQNKGLVAK